MTPDQKKILKFIEVLDQFKFITRIIDLQKEDTSEDDAQHSWHLAMMVWLFAPHFEEKIDLEKAIKMALMHDLPEIYAGDTFFYDDEARKTKKQRENNAAKKLFKMLPRFSKQEIHLLWEEYEGLSSPESRLVQAMDKIHPIIEINLGKGKTWHKHKITEKMIRERKTSYTQGSKFFTSLFNTILKEARKNGHTYKG